MQVEELEEQYGFFGGSLPEVLKYFERSDLPSNLWEWQTLSSVCCVSGMSAVLKKDGFSQRKLMMAVPFNFLAVDVKERSVLGMEGGGRFQDYTLVPIAGRAPVATKATRLPSSLFQLGCVSTKRPPPFLLHL